MRIKMWILGIQVDHIRNTPAFFFFFPPMAQNHHLSKDTLNSFCGIIPLHCVFHLGKKIKLILGREMYVDSQQQNKTRKDKSP